MRSGIPFLAVLGVFVVPAQAWACSQEDGSLPFELDPDSTDTTPPEIRNVDLLVHRADCPEACGDWSYIELAPDVVDDETRPEFIGFETFLVDGAIPGLDQSSGGLSGLPRTLDGGLLDYAFGEDDGSPYHFVLSVRAIDNGGNRSDGFEIDVSDGENPDYGCACGCSTTAPQSAPPLGFGAALVALAAWRRGCRAR
jgi:MYXO-CTERM domain-containing protein